MASGMGSTMTEARKARRGQIHPQDSSRSGNTLFLILRILAGLLKAVRALAVIFQRSIWLLPWVQQFVLGRLEEEI
jgi:hypothetical protein